MRARFVVRLTASFERDLEHLPAAAQSKILEEIGRLESNPFGPPPKIKKLKGRGVGQWRLQVWPYRVRYDVVGQDVVLYRVRHRKEIYRD
jgi:mRNA interferase RelE/StbE